MKRMNEPAALVAVGQAAHIAQQPQLAGRLELADEFSQARLGNAEFMV